MALRSRRINNFLELCCLVGLGGLLLWVSLINFQKSNSSWPQQPTTEKVLKFHDSTPKSIVFKIKLNLITWMTLKSSVVIFQALEPLRPHWPHPPWQPHWPIPSKNFRIQILFCAIDHQKFIFSLIPDALSVGGCWGQLMLLFWDLVDET